MQCQRDPNIIYRWTFEALIKIIVLQKLEKALAIINLFYMILSVLDHWLSWEHVSGGRQYYVEWDLRYKTPRIIEVWQLDAIPTQYYSPVFCRSPGTLPTICYICARLMTKKITEPAHEIMALFVFHKLILQTRMYSHPMGLDVWFMVSPFVYVHTSILHVCEQRRLWRDCADAQARMSLRWSPMR